MASEDIGTDDTLLAMPMHPPQPPIVTERPAVMFTAAIPHTARRRNRPWWIVGLVGAIVVGLAVAIAGATYAMRASARIADESSSADSPASLAPPSPAQPPPRAAPPPIAHSPEELVALEEAALARADTAALAALLTTDAFAIGRDADQLATGPAGVADALSSSLGAGRDRLARRSLHIGRDGDDLAWLATELDVAATRFAATQLAVRDPKTGTWRAAAWHLAERVPNRRAYALAKDGTLPSPIAITERGDRPLRIAFQAAFASRQRLTDAFADRDDTVDFGSAPGERILGGPAIKRAFGKLTAELAIHDGVATGRVTARAGWAAANVDYVLRDGTAQTYRVLAILVDDKVVLAHWSNGGPL
jgi:SnoaL-like protein